MNNQNSLSANLCTTCAGAGKISGKDCNECQGSGYIAKDQNGNEYFLKVDGENLIVTGAKNNTQSKNNHESNYNQNQQSDNKIIKEDSNVNKLIGNIFFELLLLPLILITLLYFRNNYILYAIIVIVISLWGFFNIIYLPENLVSPIKKDFISAEEPKDLHWAIQEIKKYANAN